MGKNKNKRKAGISGLARFVLESFNTDNTAASSSIEPIQGSNSQSSAPPSAKKQKVDDGMSVPTLAEPTQDGGALSAPAVQASSSKIAAPRKAYNASGLVPHYENASQVPEHLQKYFSQRYRYFSLYSEPPGCLLDEEGWFSVTPERIANQIAERCRCDTILDGFCGVGGNAIAFAQTCNRVIALDISSTRLALARHNAEIYGVADRIEFVQADYLSFIENQVLQSNTRKIDVIFLSPPWGGPSYLDGPAQVQTPAEGEHPPYHLSSIQPIHGADLFKRSRVVTPNIAYFLPRNTVLSEIAELAGNEKVEVEEEWTGSKLKALTCYYGGLAEGQGHLF
ncbi:S-adenosyl-L-methionine-dependent methyltransferase [Coprinellus micaceus]|uniref:Trimethylguanosine synthase n=1 Tax=Coprinellus micaceus TaxID=71717 RepID=A0A4Y7U0D6_COPMI|nr:S-adenosyl-L-methionine-dependent methyltransferase [Coprinellus micaceus]